MGAEKEIEKWVKRIQRSGDRKAGDKLISFYLDEIFGYVFNRVDNRETAKDVTQEIFISVLQSINNYQVSQSTFRTWLYRIAERRVVDHYRQKERREGKTVEFSEVEIGSRDTSYSNAENLLELAEVNQFIDNLEGKRRDIFKLKVMDGYTFAEISDLLGMSESTIKTSFYGTQRLIRLTFKEGSA